MVTGLALLGALVAARRQAAPPAAVVVPSQRRRVVEDDAELVLAEQEARDARVLAALDRVLA